MLAEGAGSEDSSEAEDSGELGGKSKAGWATRGCLGWECGYFYLNTQGRARPPAGWRPECVRGPPSD